MSENPIALTEALDKPATASVGLWRIFGAFFWLGCTSFGGGSAGWLYREMVLKRRWIDDRTFLAAMALGQVMPGANGVKLSVLIGQHLKGAPGEQAEHRDGGDRGRAALRHRAAQRLERLAGHAAID